MTTKSIRVISAAETAYTLRCTLGPLFAWEVRLTDMRRGKVSNGPILLPIAEIEAARGWRPVYSPGDIRAFIVAYRAYSPGLSHNPKPQQMTVLTEEGDRRHWSERKLPGAVYVC